MRNYIKILLTLSVILVLSCVIASAEGERAYTTADVLNIRLAPSTDSEIVGQYPYGSTLDITDKYDVWYQIRYNSSYAYVHGDYVAFSSTQSLEGQMLGEQLVETAKAYIGTPYVYGGMSPYGFDCSGFVKYVYSLYGVNLPRVSHDQANAGVWVSREDLKPGDIICFSQSAYSNYIGHVGIYVGDNMFIHSPRTGYSVCIESLNNSYGLRYQSARRIFWYLV